MLFRFNFSFIKDAILISARSWCVYFGLVLFSVYLKLLSQDNLTQCFHTMDRVSRVTIFSMFVKQEIFMCGAL